MRTNHSSGSVQCDQKGDIAPTGFQKTSVDSIFHNSALARNSPLAVGVQSPMAARTTKTRNAEIRRESDQDGFLEL